MSRVLLDIETTSKDPLNAEIIEGYFENIDTGDCFLFKSRVNKWSNEAEKIHGISEIETALYPNKKDSLVDLYNWLNSQPKETEYIMFANEKTEYGAMYFDCAVIESELEWQDLRWRFNNKTSVHTMAKQAYKKGFFNPIRKKETNRISFGQAYVFEAIFGYKPDGQHRAKSDVEALKKIYFHLDDSLNSGIPINIDQLSFL